MKKSIVNFIKAIIIIVVFASALLLASRILMLKSEDGYTQIQSYYKQKKDTVDVLFLGSSKIYCQVDTGILWDDYGMASFDLGGAEAPSWNSYFYMKEALKTQKPKVIVYDAGIIGYRHDFLYQEEVWTITNAYGMKWNKNRIDLLKLNCENDKQFKHLLFPLDRMHTRYKELTKNDFFDENNSINYKGFDYRNTVVPFDTPTAIKIKDAIPINEKHEKYLREMMALARENNIPFVVIISPYVITDVEQMYFNSIKAICEDEGVTFLDLNQKYDELGIDFQTDMAENIHLNFSGTKKLSDYLGKYVKENYDIPDRRGDEKYKSWEVDAAINRQNREMAQADKFETKR